jgi:DNA-binding transcriptional ArsR family regulator
MAVELEHEPSDLSLVFHALGDLTRCRVVEILGSGPRRAGELAEETGVDASAMSRHLKALLTAGIVTAERRSEDARVRVFRLRGDSIIAVQAWLDQLQAGWSEQLDSLKAHIEREYSS